MLVGAGRCLFAPRARPGPPLGFSFSRNGKIVCRYHSRNLAIANRGAVRRRSSRWWLGLEPAAEALPCRDAQVSSDSSGLRAGQPETSWTDCLITDSSSRALKGSTTWSTSQIRWPQAGQLATSRPNIPRVPAPAASIRFRFAPRHQLFPRHHPLWSNAHRGLAACCSAGSRPPSAEPLRWWPPAKGTPSQDRCT